MKTNLTTTRSRALARLFKSTFTAAHLPGVVLLLSVQISHAYSAIWKLNPVSGDWNDPANWTPETVPNGPSDIATFSVRDQTAVSLSGFVIPELSGIVFDAGPHTHPA